MTKLFVLTLLLITVFSCQTGSDISTVEFKWTLLKTAPKKIDSIELNGNSNHQYITFSHSMGIGGGAEVFEVIMSKEDTLVRTIYRTSNVIHAIECDDSTFFWAETASIQGGFITTFMRAQLDFNGQDTIDVPIDFIRKIYKSDLRLACEGSINSNNYLKFSDFPFSEWKTDSTLNSDYKSFKIISKTDKGIIGFCTSDFHSGKKLMYVNNDHMEVKELKDLRFKSDVFKIISHQNNLTGVVYGETLLAYVFNGKEMELAYEIELPDDHLHVLNCIITDKFIAITLGQYQGDNDSRTYVTFNQGRDWEELAGFDNSALILNSIGKMLIVDDENRIWWGEAK